MRRKYLKIPSEENKHTNVLLTSKIKLSCRRLTLEVENQPLETEIKLEDFVFVGL